MRPKSINWFKTTVFLVIAFCMVIPSSAGPAPAPRRIMPPVADSPEPVLIRLRAATFDPLQALPDLPASLSLTEQQAAAAGVYILQFSGPVLPEWKQAIINAGGQLGGYIPDYAFLVRLDAAARAQAAALPFVRWIGPYQPAFKLSPDVDYADTRSYRVILAPWANADAPRTALQAMDANTRSFNGGLSAVLNGEQLDQAARVPDVIWIEPYYMQRLYNDVGGGTIMGGSTAWSSGYTGNGVTVAIADTGLDTGNPANIHQDFTGRVAHISSWPVVAADYGGGCAVTNPGADDGPSDTQSGHGTHVAGSVAGSGLASSGTFKGLAYQASVTFQAIEQYTQYTSQCGVSGNAGYGLSGIPDDIRTLLQEAYDWGARVHNNSWGGGQFGVYDTQASLFDDFIYNHQDMAVFAAAGNAGKDSDSSGYVDENSISSPATSKNVITVGASENERPSNPSAGYTSYTWGTGSWLENFPAPPTRDDRISSSREHMAAFSSRGPMNDGRIKPDVVAPGTDIISVRSSLATSTGWGPYNTYYMYMGGTSMASPLSAGAGALVRDYYIDHESHANPSAALIKATLINSAVDIAGYGNSGQEAGLPIPNNHEGWGRINVGAATTPGSRQFEDNTTGVNTGATQTYHYTVSAGKPFKVTLVWSDYMGTPGAGAALVNNLNLRVTAPGGAATYLGNHFSGGWSQTGGSADTVNNVENVYVQSPAAGQWTVEVIGQNVPNGPQKFALVVDGNLTAGQPAPTVSSITPNSGTNDGSVSVTIAGNNFQSGAAVKLTRSGQTDIDATGENVAGATQITCNFNLTGAATGQWNVVVTNPDNQSGTLTNGFTVNAPFTGKTWTGSVSSDWHTAGNWSPSGAPTAGDDVVIPNVTHDPVISTGDAAVNNLTLESGAVLDLTTRALTVEGVLTNNGAIKQTRTVNGATQFLRITNQAGTQTKYYGVDITPSTLAQATAQARLSPLRPAASSAVSARTGFAPPLADLSHLTGKLPDGAAPRALPSSFDWRSKSGQNYVSPVKNQANCGSCYSFAAIGNIEAKVKIDSGAPLFYDFSENNVKECNWNELNDTGGGSCDGGNYQMLVTLLSSKGTVLEADDPYQDSDVDCITPAAYQKTLLDWRLISGDNVPDPAVLKQYIYDNGPVYTSIYAGYYDAWSDEFNAYDGSYTLYYTGAEDTNHAVLIVGWDDSLTHAGGAGGWIVKNSWGTNWGDGGFFKIAYGSARIGSYSSYMQAWKDYASSDQLLLYDEPGADIYYGYGSTVGWGLAKFTPASSGNVTRVELWNSDSGTTVDIYLYDSFNGTAPSGLLAQKTGVRFNEAGYHSVLLDAPLPVSAGNDIVAVAKFTNDSYEYPIPLAYYGDNSNNTYISYDGSSGSWQPADYDVAIRLRLNTGAAAPAPTVSGIAPATGVNTGTVSVSITGNNFQSGATVKLTRSGQTDIVATNVVRVSATQLTCDLNLSGKAAGAWNVVVTNPDNQSGTLANGFTITEPSGSPAPTVSGIAPATGVNTGTVSVSITGANFQTGATVKLTRSGQTDIAATNVVRVSATQLTCDLNLVGKAAGVWNVVVTNPDNQSGTLSSGFTVTSGSVGPVNVTVTISGDQFCSGRAGDIRRCYDIAPAAALNATVRFYFTEAERNNLALSSLLVLHYNGSAWTQEPGPYTRGGSGSAQYVEAQNISDFSPFALGSPTRSIYLPVVFKNWPPVPQAPTLNSISPNPSTDGNYTVSWTPGSGPAATSYDLQENSTIILTGLTGTSRAFTGKVPGAYTYRVRGVNSYGAGPWSNAQSVTVQQPPSGPTPGFWESTTGDEFYVTPDRANVDNFAVYVSVPGCGNIKITRTTPTPITNNTFSFSGAFYASGTFDSATAAHGVDGLNNYYSTTCSKYISGGPWDWNATWKNSSQPLFLQVEIIELETDSRHSAHEILAK